MKQTRQLDNNEIKMVAESTSRARKKAEPSKSSSDNLCLIPTMLSLTSQQGKAGAVPTQDTSPSTSAGTTGDPIQPQNTTSPSSPKTRRTTKPTGAPDNSPASSKSYRSHKGG